MDVRKRRIVKIIIIIIIISNILQVLTSEYRSMQWKIFIQNKEMRILIYTAKIRAMLFFSFCACLCLCVSFADKMSFKRFKSGTLTTLLSPFDVSTVVIVRSRHSRELHLSSFSSSLAGHCSGLVVRHPLFAPRAAPDF